MRLFGYRFFLCLVLVGCSPAYQPKQTSNICKMFMEHPQWYWSASDAEARWQTPIAVQMAFINQESHFSSKIRPQRSKLFGVIPWKRPSTSFGYAQAVQPTWYHYQAQTHQKGRRSKFHDSTDFVAWYGYTISQQTGIAQDDPYHLYLAYHEGVGGYRQHSYEKKPWLDSVARRVAATATHYQQQLDSCQHLLPRRAWWHFWSYGD